MVVLPVAPRWLLPVVAAVVDLVVVPREVSQLEVVEECQPVECLQAEAVEVGICRHLELFIYELINR